MYPTIAGGSLSRWRRPSSEMRLFQALETQRKRMIDRTGSRTKTSMARSSESMSTMMIDRSVVVAS
ncbi:F-box protein-like [Iris pallida]|uniref:F-box protein-like n=1 Tax=Iris pallida TaxID=29817 RepID=A0AAX6H5D8_IRIPA|nr:F-box protein-like [Iris pallida]